MNKSDITAHICREAKNEFGWSEGQIAYIREILAPLGYSRDYDNSNLGKPRLENLNIDVLKDFIDVDKIKSLEKDKKQELFKVVKVIEDRVRNVCDDEHIPLVGHDERDPKVSTNKPIPGKSEIYYAVDDVYEEAKVLVKNLEGVRDKVFQFPPTTKEADREDANKIRSLAVMFSALNKFLPSLKDEKWSFSKWQWCDTAVKEEIYSKHGAAVKSKVEIIDETGKPTGRFRAKTRERVGDTKEEMYKFMQEFSTMMKTYAFWMGFADWRDVHSEINGRIAERIERLSPKLSEASIS